MPTITQEEIAKIAHLSRIALTDVEYTELSKKFDPIFDLLNHISDVDTGSLTPMPSQDGFQPLRDDIITETNQRDTLLACAGGGKNTEAGLYLVPAVIE